MKSSSVVILSVTWLIAPTIDLIMKMETLQSKQKHEEILKASFYIRNPFSYASWICLLTIIYQLTVAWNTCRVGFGYSSFHIKRVEDVGKKKKAGSGNTLVARAALLVAFLSSSAHSAPFFFLSPILLAAKSGLWSTEDFIIDSFRGGCRPSDKLGGGWSSRPCDKGGRGLKKIYFSASSGLSLV